MKTRLWEQLGERVRAGRALTRRDAMAVLQSKEEDLLAVLQAAFRVRHRHFGRRVRLHVIDNAKSGLCTEDCRYCSQSDTATSGAPKYPLRSVDAIVQGARKASRAYAFRYCIVTSGRSPSDAELARVCEAVRRIKTELPIRTCASLGILTAAMARQLARAGLDRYNHNLETSERFFSRICTTHSYADRLATAMMVKASGMELCSGCLFGMGETDEDRTNVAFALRRIGADSIPVNFLDPRPGTALAGWPRLKPAEGLRLLAMLRLVLADREIRVGGGREVCLKTLQPLALFAADSMFTCGYLTTRGQGLANDRAMVEEAGFVLDGVEY